MPDLNEIRLFVEVVRGGSFAEAARRLGMPANTVSRRIQHLEDELKSRLILRTTRKLALTSVGQTFYEQCAGSIDGLAQATQEATDVHEPAGPLRVALSSSFFEIFPISWITDFLSQYPKVELELVVDNAYLDLVDGGIDLAFRSNLTLNENSTRRVLTSTRRRLVTSPQYIALHGVPDSLNQLVQHQCLLTPLDTESTWRLNGPNGREEVRVKGRFVCSTPGVIRQAALEGVGIALLPDIMVRQDISAGRLISMFNAYRSDEIQFCAVFPNHRHIRRATTAFVEHVLSQLHTIRHDSDTPSEVLSATSRGG